MQCGGQLCAVPYHALRNTLSGFSLRAYQTSFASKSYQHFFAGPCQVELVAGGRPILAAIMAHDRPAGLPMVLVISSLPEASGRVLSGKRVFS